MDLKNMCMSSVFSKRHRLSVNTCADALKSLSTAAELAGVQFNFIIKAFATARKFTTQVCGSTVGQPQFYRWAIVGSQRWAIVELLVGETLGQ